MQVVPGASNVASSGAGSCNVTLPEKPETLVNVTLSTDCPVNSNGCSGPSDIVPLAILNTLTPCCHAHGKCKCIHLKLHTKQHMPRLYISSLQAEHAHVYTPGLKFV